MEIIIIASFSIVLLIGCLSFGQTGVSSVLSKSDYQSGFNHGISDVKDSCTHTDGCHWYVLGKGKGFAFHSKEFIRGYIAGWCLHVPVGGGSDADQARFECGKPGHFPEGNGNDKEVCNLAEDAS
jgi:hypothetical protein